VAVCSLPLVNSSLPVNLQLVEMSRLGAEMVGTEAALRAVAETEAGTPRCSQQEAPDKWNLHSADEEKESQVSTHPSDSFFSPAPTCPCPCPFPCPLASSVCCYLRRVHHCHCQRLTLTLTLTLPYPEATIQQSIEGFIAEDRQVNHPEMALK
jgi:hypothetical protein